MITGEWYDPRSDQYVDYDVAEPTVDRSDPIEPLPIFGPDGAVIGEVDLNPVVGFARAIGRRS